MTTRTASLLATAILAATVLSGCGIVSSIPGFGAADAPAAVAPDGPDTPPAMGSDPSTGGGSGGSTGGGSAGDGSSTPPATDDPNTGVGVGVLPPGGIPDNPTIVTAHPGQVDLRDVSVAQLTSLVAVSHHVIVRVRWWGGIEPCEVLDSVAVSRDGSTFTIAARVGAANGGSVACVDIARDTATLVDLGILPAGRYTVQASKGDVAPITIVVP